METNSGVTFTQAQVALAREWVAGDDLTNQKEVTVSFPQEDAGLVPADTSKGTAPPKTLTVPIPASEQEAREIVKRFENGAGRSDASVSDNVVQHMMSDKTSLLDEGWLGTEEEELNAYVFISAPSVFASCTKIFQQICFGGFVHPLQVDDCR